MRHIDNEFAFLLFFLISTFVTVCLSLDWSVVRRTVSLTTYYLPPTTKKILLLRHFLLHHGASLCPFQYQAQERILIGLGFVFLCVTRESHVSASHMHQTSVVGDFCSVLFLPFDGGRTEEIEYEWLEC